MLAGRFVASAAVATMLSVTGLGAQEFPTRQIRVVVPFPAGGSIDSTARIVGQKVAELARQSVIVENRAGAAGNIGADVVAKSVPDGYTILQTVNGLSLGPALYKKLPFDALKDFIPVVQIAESPLLIVANAKSPIKSLSDLVSTAKQKPGVLNYGSTGVGISLHLTMEMLRMAAGIDIVHIPFKGDAPLLNALVAGDVEVACVPFATTLPHVQAGTIRALAVTTSRRVELVPDTPTLAEVGFPAVESASWQGWFVPTGTPQPIVLKLNGYARAALRSPEVLERYKALGHVAVDTSPEQFGSSFKADVEKWAKVVKDINLPPQD